MDIIGHAQARREALKAELDRIEQFLATAFELQHELARSTPRDTRTNAEKADAPVRKRAMAPAGAGSATVRAVVTILQERGPMPTRELLPLVLAQGIEVGGQDPVATLSARISGKGRVQTREGKWHLIENSGATAPEEGVTDIPTKATSATSLFYSNQEDDDAAALVE